MDAKNIQFLVEKAKNDILREVNDRLPRKVGITAVNHFRQNFRDAGFRDGGIRDGGIRQWQRTRRQDSNTPDAKYSPLTSRRDHLMRSIEFQAQPGRSSSPTICPMLPSTTMEATSLRTHLLRQSFVSMLGTWSTPSPPLRASSPRSYLQRQPSGRRSHLRRSRNSLYTPTFRCVSS